MRFGCLVFILFVFFFTTSVVQAATPSPSAGTPISLSEVFACQDSTHPEWIEVFNSSGSDVDLSNWKVERKSTGDWNTPKPLTATISAGSYKKFDFTNYMNDGGFFIRLKDSTDAVVETFPDSETASKCSSGSILTSWIKQGISWSLTTTLTPGEQNTFVAPVTPSPTPTPMTTTPTASPKATTTPAPTPTVAPATATPGPQPTSVTLSEVYACQEDSEKEWVEIHNSASTSVTISDWKLTDDDHNDQPIPSQSISGDGYAVIEISKYSKGMLTNSGDVVHLLDGAGKTVDTFTYVSCTKGKTWQKAKGTWQEANTITRGSVNPQPKAGTPTPQPEGDGADIRVAQVMGAEESSPSGYILGTQDSDSSDPLVPTATPLPQSPSRQSTRLFSIGLIITGIVIILGSAGYYGWHVWKKKQSN